jgi:hypothetical protein
MHRLINFLEYNLIPEIQGLEQSIQSGDLPSAQCIGYSSQMLFCGYILASRQVRSHWLLVKSACASMSAPFLSPSRRLN